LQLVLWASVAEWSAEQYRFRNPSARARTPAFHAKQEFEAVLLLVVLEATIGGDRPPWPRGTKSGPFLLTPLQVDRHVLRLEELL
jgi:hypothetical protein